MLTPPTKPTWPVSLVSAAAAPTRNEPCSSANVRLATLSASTTVSTMANVVSGKSAAAAVMASV